MKDKVTNTHEEFMKYLDWLENDLKEDPCRTLREDW
jgi:hypothetical protein